MDSKIHQLLSGIPKLRPGTTAALERDLRHNRLDLEKLSERISELEGRIDQLSLFSMAAWDVLRERTGASDEDLQEDIARLAEQRTEQSMASTEDCPECGRVMSRRHGRCLYCRPEPREGD